MAISKDERDELKLVVLIETEKMFSRIMSEYQCPEHHEKMHFLLDIESAMKEGLVEIGSAKATEPAN
jgi:hypothetical protein